MALWHALRHSGKGNRLGIVWTDDHVSIAVIKTKKANNGPQIKKGLGGEFELLALTQSYALSHIARIVAQFKSSASIALFLPCSALTHLELALPQDVPLAELDSTLGFLLEQQGFAPLDTFIWDAEKITTSDITNDTEQRYQVMLTNKEKLQDFYRALNLNPRQVRFAGAPPSPTDCGDTTFADSVSGPWLCTASRDIALSALLGSGSLC
ncbi:hypothetical protein [Aliidiomarina soli]|uniref:GspL cytoplasmic actin-ATPase-like domain-containing protein n=1 Tax=Aliidiomarina soli TaxID=1928574 RepID=A0A432WEZ4_9GAMM|nr:hypothetical protein [Aliidiomarina soli]RUO32366.1 hypothetical protein CWE14_09455 [Aliidiomarina soli]